jgi:hypothetical protein
MKVAEEVELVEDPEVSIIEGCEGSSRLLGIVTTGSNVGGMLECPR